jgi:glucokinase
MGRYAVGIDIGGTRTKIGIVDLDRGAVRDMLLTPTERYDAGKFISGLFSQYLSLLENTGIRNDEVAGLGIGAPGFVYDDGSVDSTFGFLPFMDLHYPLRQELEKKFSLPCMVDNDARIVALGEAIYGRGKGYSRVLVLTLGTGLGIGLVVNGRFETTLPYAHLGGHITIADSDVVCYCGRSGCMEALVSATGITGAAARAGLFESEPGIPQEARAVFEAAQRGNEKARMIISELIRHLSTGISNYITLFVPEIIIIGGGVSKGLSPYLDTIRQLKYLPPFSTYKFEIALSDLDELSGILGSAALFNN